MSPERITSLDALYGAESGSAHMTGVQALVRLPLMQRRLDRRAGLSTAGLISGYRGSPLGAYDRHLWAAADHLAAHDITFQPGLNEDLAATALWGAQMHTAFGPARVDGVFGIWYGKGNGVDRSGDAFRMANAYGTSPLGGVLAVAGDDHAAQSSIFPHQTDGIFRSVMMPVLQPANVSEILSLGLAGIALSRFSGLWVAMKTIAEVVESATSFDLPDPDPVFVAPPGLAPPHGLGWDPRIAWPGERAELERRLVEDRLPAAVGWAVANRLDRPVMVAERPRLCVVTVGKAHQDLLQALADLELGPSEIQALGLSVYKVAMSWPLASAPLAAFARGSEEIFVIEEKAGTVEDQLKAAMFGQRGHLPRITGKTDGEGRPLLPSVSELSAAMVAEALVRRLGDGAGLDLNARLRRIRSGARTLEMEGVPTRKPFFCSGCPHNTSTRVPDGSLAGGGIGCHVLAVSQPERKAVSISQMGGEGAQWIGAAPFSKTGHIFQNLGDGTYQHSGVLAVRAAVAAGTNITFKLLHNDAVAMTGGQPIEGALDPLAAAAQLIAEGVRDVRVVADDPEPWRRRADMSPAVRLHGRDALDAVQRELREIPGVTAIVYVQTCAAEKRRRRKQGRALDPDRRVFINARVCEGCGDCSVQSNCIAIEPVDTEYGLKRKVNQSSCNKDYSCAAGFCPSFVEISGARLHRPDAERLEEIETARFAALGDPARTPLEAPYNILVAGIGGMGVLTVGALLGSAAHLDGKASTVLDFTGLSQKNGAVVSHVRIAGQADQVPAARIADGQADLVLAADAVVAAGAEARAKFGKPGAALVLNLHETPTADSVTDRDARPPTARIVSGLLRRAGDRGFSMDATRLAEALFGDSLAANTLLVGYAFQLGLLPLSAEAIDQAIVANRVAVDLNRRAFRWGRLAAVDLDGVLRAAGLNVLPAHSPAAETLNALIERRASDLSLFQDARYADRYRRLAYRALDAAEAIGPSAEGFARAVAVNGYKLMAYKDEYEVARLYVDPEFRRALRAEFSPVGSVSVWLSPPILSRPDAVTGRPAKRRFGQWIFPLLSALARLKGLRGTWADPFGHTEERRTERALIREFEDDVRRMCEGLSPATLAVAVDLAQAPDMIRGFGPVKRAAVEAYRARRAALRGRLETPVPKRAAA